MSGPLLLLLTAAILMSWTVLCLWLDRRYVDPWLRRRVGLPPKVDL